MFLFSCPQEGDTPLIEAASRGDDSIVVLLLQHKADPNISNKVSTDTVSVRVVYQGINESRRILLICFVMLPSNAKFYVRIN